MVIGAGVPALPPRRLPIREIILRSYGYVWAHQHRLVRPLALLFLVFFGTDMAKVGLVPNDAAADSEPASSIVIIVGAAMLDGLIVAALAVGLHRWVLLGEFRPGFDMLRWGADFRRYFGSLIAVTILCFGPLIVAFSAVEVGTAESPNWVFDLLLGGILIAGCLCTVASCRYSLVLPAVALGKRAGFRHVWRVTRGNTWRLAAVNLLLVIPFCLVEGLADIAADDRSLVMPVRLPAIIVIDLSDAVYAAIYVVFLSLSYDFLGLGTGVQVLQD